MTFEEALEKYKPNTKIKIGADDGTGFFYVGTVGDIVDGMSKFEKIDHAYYKNRLKSARQEFASEVNRDVSIMAYAKNVFNRVNANKSIGNPFSEEDYQRFVAHHFKLLNAKYKTKLEEEEANNNYIPLSRRTVSGTFKAAKPVDDNVTVIMVSGYEKGAYWTYDEAESAPSMKFAGNNEE